jgi:hypothetical protein
LCVLRLAAVGNPTGWYHAGQGVTDFDGGGHDVKWHYGDHPGIRNSEASKAVSGSIVFTDGGPRTYSLAASVVYDSPVENAQIDRAHPDGATRIRLVLRPLPRIAKHGERCGLEH